MGAADRLSISLAFAVNPLKAVGEASASELSVKRWGNPAIQAD